MNLYLDISRFDFKTFDFKNLKTKKMKTSIVWFKTDLRLTDNETLIKAISQSEQIIPVYCFDDSHFETTKYGFKKTGSYRAQFLLESLRDLDSNLREIGSGLS
jgi:deoxyribodipyrimidine photo-lyase